MESTYQPWPFVEPGICLFSEVLYDCVLQPCNLSLRLRTEVRNLRVACDCFHTYVNARLPPRTSGLLLEKATSSLPVPRSFIQPWISSTGPNCIVTKPTRPDWTKILPGTTHFHLADFSNSSSSSSSSSRDPVIGCALDWHSSLPVV
jgi:hypothetical protein